jgi:uncharacterized damage-inducible protein DinB
MRSELDSITSWYVYNSNFRKKFIPVIFEKVPEEERYKNKEASFNSLVGIFVHVLNAYMEWFLMAENKSPDYKPLDLQKLYTRTEVTEEERNVDTYVMTFVRKLQPEDLDKKIAWQDSRGKMEIELRGILLHMIEDELQHRGELNALLWQMDIKPPTWGYDDWTPRDIAT